jgi:arginyl-tRNA synthetase
MTQDVGTALTRVDKYDSQRMIYVVANEQDRHFEILFKLLEHMRPELKGKRQILFYSAVFCCFVSFR